MYIHIYLHIIYYFFLCSSNIEQYEKIKSFPVNSLHKIISKTLSA